MSARSPLARARGLGAARAGVGHWTHQRLTAISNLLLVLWFVFSAMALAGAGLRRRCAPGSPRRSRRA